MLHGVSVNVFVQRVCALVRAAWLERKFSIFNALRWKLGFTGIRHAIRQNPREIRHF